MMWIIALTVLLINQYKSGELWGINTVKSLAVLGAAAVQAYRNPGETLLLAVVGLSCFISWELYLTDIRRNRREKQA